MRNDSVPVTSIELGDSSAVGSEDEMKTTTFGELKKKGIPPRFRSVRDEIRQNLIEKLRKGEDVLPGIIGFDETVKPAIINALLSRHDFILLGLRGQAKSRILRGITQLLDDEIPVIAESEINDDPFFPISEVSRRRIELESDQLPIRFLKREDRYVEKLATPDVTVADIIGDLDPIKAARRGTSLSSLENIHFGLLPRAHRGIFAVNELPDLAPKIQVALLNIMQEGDVQIRGFPVRLPLDVLLIFSANPEDYTARGKIITPLKDRIGSEIRTHYPLRLREAVRITRQEAWAGREEMRVQIPEFISEIIEMVAFVARQDSRIDRRSGVSQRMPISCAESSLSNAEQRALLNQEQSATVRIADIFASLPAITGKLELEYEGELKGAERIARELIQLAVHEIFDRRFPKASFEQVVQWFNLGGEVHVSELTSDAEYLQQIGQIQGLEAFFEQFKVDPKQAPGLAVSAAEFLLEGLCAQKKLSRSESRGYYKEPEDIDAFSALEANRKSFN